MPLVHEVRPALVLRTRAPYSDVPFVQRDGHPRTAAGQGGGVDEARARGGGNKGTTPAARRPRRPISCTDTARPAGRGGPLLLPPAASRCKKVTCVYTGASPLGRRPPHCHAVRPASVGIPVGRGVAAVSVLPRADAQRTVPRWGRVGEADAPARGAGPPPSLRRRWPPPLPARRPCPCDQVCTPSALCSPSNGPCAAAPPPRVWDLGGEPSIRVASPPSPPLALSLSPPSTTRQA